MRPRRLPERRPDRPRPADSLFLQRARDAGLRRRHPGLRASRQRRDHRRPQLQVRTTARDRRPRGRGTQRHRGRRRRRRHDPEPARDGDRTLRRAHGPHEPRAVAGRGRTPRPLPADRLLLQDVPAQRADSGPGSGPCARPPASGPYRADPTRTRTITSTIIATCWSWARVPPVSPPPSRHAARGPASWSRTSRPSSAAACWRSRPGSTGRPRGHGLPRPSPNLSRARTPACSREARPAGSMTTTS